MRALPYERLTLVTSRKPEEVEALLAEMIAARWRITLRSPPQPLRGKLTLTHFKVVRALGAASNAWAPVIVGDIVPVPEGTELRLRFRLAVAVAIFMLFWFGGLFFGAAMLLCGGLEKGFGPGSTSCGAQGCLGAGIGLAGMVLAGYALMSVSFWGEVRRARALLSERLGCQPAEVHADPLDGR